MNDKNPMRIWLPLGVYCLLILIQSALPLPVFTLRHADKVAHFAAYAILGILLFRGLTSLSKKNSPVVMVLTAVFLSALIGLSDEIIQIFVPTRSIDREDFFFDVLGSLSGIIVYLIVLRQKRPTGTESSISPHDE